MLQIKEIMRKQQQAGREIAGQLPQTAGQSPPKKTGRKGGFLKRLFGKKEKTETSPNASALHDPQQDHCGQTAAYARQFSELGHISSDLPATGCSNEQLQQVIRHMDRNIQEEIAATGGEAGQDGQTVTGHSRRAGGVHAPAARRLLHDYTPGHGTHKPLQEKAGGNNRAIRTYRRRKRGADRGKKKNHADRDP